MPIQSTRHHALSSGEDLIVNPANNLTTRDKRALLLYLGIALLCAACFAIGLSVGRSTPAAESKTLAGAVQSAAHNPQSPAPTGR